jgi:hypothetical protein
MKIIHALNIVDKSTSMVPYRNRTIEGINSNINALKTEVDKDTKILNTQLQFSAESSNWHKPSNNPETDFVFKHIGTEVQNLPDMVSTDYIPSGGTPLLDAIGYGVEKIKEFHGDELGDENLKIIVTVFSDGEENSSTKWNHADIKKMIEHFESDNKWTFTFIGCGSFENVSKTSSTFGVKSHNTVAYAATADGYTDGFSKISTSYLNYARATKSGFVDNDLFTSKTHVEVEK